MLVTDAFLDANHGVILESDICGCVLLIGDVEEPCVVGEELLLGLRHCEERARFAEEEGGFGVLAIDGDVLDEPGRKKSGADGLGAAVVVFEEVAGS